jgi:hypothetical protein
MGKPQPVENRALEHRSLQFHVTGLADSDEGGFEAGIGLVEAASVHEDGCAATVVGDGLALVAAYRLDADTFLRHRERLFFNAGFDPWMDQMRLLPGRDWERAIHLAIRSADVSLPAEQPVEKHVEYDFIVLESRRNTARWKRAPRFSTGC